MFYERCQSTLFSTIKGSKMSNLLAFYQSASEKQYSTHCRAFEQMFYHYDALGWIKYHTTKPRIMEGLKYELLFVLKLHQIRRIQLFILQICWQCANRLLICWPTSQRTSPIFYQISSIYIHPYTFEWFFCQQFSSLQNCFILQLDHSLLTYTKSPKS